MAIRPLILSKPGLAAGVLSSDALVRDVGKTQQNAPIGVLMAVGLGSGAMAAMLVLQHAAAFPVFVTSWASSTALILGAEETPAVRPTTVFMAHATCAAIGFVAALAGAHHDWVIVPAFGIALCAMLALGFLHPPAAANAVIPSVVVAPLGLVFSSMLLGGASMAVLALGMRSLTLRRCERSRRARNSLHQEHSEAPI